MLDLRAQLAALPRAKDAQPQNTPLRPRSITFHYSAVAYADRGHDAEMARIFSEARYHLAKNWARPGQPVIHGSRYQYHYVVLSDGTVAFLNDFVSLWHAGNAQANAESIAVHVMLGGQQDVTAPQHAAVVRLFDVLRADHGIPRSAVYGHNEWPRNTGAPQPSPTYRTLPGQSECPGRVLFGLVVGYRGGAPTHRAKTVAYVRSGATVGSKHIGTLAPREPVTVVRIAPGQVFQGSDLWAELSGGGYVWARQLEAIT